MRKLFLLLLSLPALQSIAQNGTQPVTLTDMLRIKTVGNIAVTKDGSRAAFTVTSIEPDEANKNDYKYLTQLYSINLSNGATPQALTTAKEGASQPAWSPDGKQLAFVRPVAGKPQIFALSMEGGEPRQLTRLAYGATNPRWSPDGTQLLFSSSVSLQDLLRDSTLNRDRMIPDWPFEKPGFSKNEHLRAGKAIANPDGSLAEIRAYLENNAADKKAIVLDKLNFQSESGISSDMEFMQLYLLTLPKSTMPLLLTKGFYSYGSADFTPDGKQIIFSTDRDSVENPDRSLESEIYLLNTDGSGLRKLLGEAGKRYSNAAISPSGKWITFQYGPTTGVNIPALAIMPTNGSVKDMITIPFDRTKGTPVWSPDEKYLYLTAQSNGGAPLYRIEIATQQVTPLSNFESGITSFGLGNNQILYSKTQVSNPSELYLADAMLQGEKQVSRFNDWVASRKLSLPEKRSFTNEKGMTVEYWVMKPTGYQAGKKYPLLLEIHGGPSAMWGPGEASMWHEFQYFCSKGYGVVYGNPRGSGGYGETFLQGNINDWGTGPSRDVLTALDQTVAQGWADTSQLLITGGSYAGYLTAWIISHDKRFATACSQRGVYDLATFFGEGNAWRLVPNYFGGYPWEPEVKKVLVRESPITYVQNITTPYIIFHGGNDRRTGFVQGEMLYRSLKVLGRPVEYVVHPGATHEITRSGDNRQRMDQMLRTYEFFERWLRK